MNNLRCVPCYTLFNCFAHTNKSKTRTILNNEASKGLILDGMWKHNEGSIFND